MNQSFLTPKIITTNNKSVIKEDVKCNDNDSLFDKVLGKVSKNCIKKEREKNKEFINVPSKKKIKTKKQVDSDSNISNSRKYSNLFSTGSIENNNILLNRVKYTICSISSNNKGNDESKLEANNVNSNTVYTQISSYFEYDSVALDILENVDKSITQDKFKDGEAKSNKGFFGFFNIISSCISCNQK